MKKYKGLTKPIKKKLDNVTRLYNYYSDLIKYNVHIEFDDKFVYKHDNYFITLFVTKNIGAFEYSFEIRFDYIYIFSNNYFNIYKNISDQLSYIEERWGI